MAKYPSEIFGFPYFNRSVDAEEARKSFLCPYVDRECYKQSRLIDIPFGVCSVHHTQQEIAVCPRRFLQNNIVFRDIARHYFDTLNDILVFPEVRLPKIGSFDFVMLKHAPMSTKILDFVVVEFQTGQTTGTGALVEGFKDFLDGQDISYKSYSFGLNLYDIWKRTFTQVLNKGIILENWGHQIFWVVQEPVYSDFENRYHLQNMSEGSSYSTVFAVYDLVSNEDRFDLSLSRMASASIDQLFQAFRNNPNIPSKDDFLGALQIKIEKEIHLNLDLRRSEKQKRLDVKPPTSTGRVRDEKSDQTSFLDDL